METLIDLDKSLFVFLNALGIELFDAFWMFVTNKKSSIPLYLFLIYYIYKKLSHAEFLKYIVLISILILFTDQLSNLFKDYFERFRPCHDETINDQIRIVKSSCGGLYGFFSAHAANSFALATFFYFSFKRLSSNFKYLFLWAIIVSYSRIYIGVHFPADVLFGSFFGILSGYFFTFSSFKIKI